VDSHLAHGQHSSNIKLSLSLTSRTAVGGGFLNRRSIPAFDRVKYPLFFLTLGGKPCDSLARNDRLARLGIDDSWEDSTTMTTENRVSSYHFDVWWEKPSCLHCRNNTSVGVHLGRDGLQPLCIRVVDQ